MTEDSDPLIGPSVMLRITGYLMTVVVLLAFGHLPSAAADSLYRWVDDYGRLHLSDQPPPNDTQSAEELALPSYVSPTLPADRDPYSILNQLKRLEESRRQLAQERWERRQRERELHLRERELAARAADRQPPERTPVYLVPRRHFRPPHTRLPDWRTDRRRPPSLWEPDHPVYRPYPPPRPVAPHGSSPGGRVGLGR